LEALRGFSVASEGEKRKSDSPHHSGLFATALSNEHDELGRQGRRPLQWSEETRESPETSLR